MLSLTIDCYYSILNSQNPFFFKEQLDKFLRFSQNIDKTLNITLTAQKDSANTQLVYKIEVIHVKKVSTSDRLVPQILSICRNLNPKFVEPSWSFLNLVWFINIYFFYSFRIR